MEKAEIMDKINACEEEYITLFCTKGREWGLYVYQDRQLPDLPSHNFLRIPEHIPVGRLRGLADVARNTAKATGRSVLRIQLSHPLSFTSARSEHWLCSCLTDESALEKAADLEFIPVDSRERAEEFIEFEIACGGDPSFVRRCAERFSSVYLADNGLTCCLCRRGGQIVGRGELFISDGVARIANIKTSPAEAEVDISNALLQHLAEESKARGAELIYTISEIEVPGFTRVKDIYAVEWQF